MYLLILITVFAASLLTLFTGFGLGTILMPVYAIFFPLDVAIALTAIVHFGNNFFKFALLKRYADKKIVFTFGVPAVLSATVGAAMLFKLSNLAPLWEYQIGEKVFFITPIKLTMAVLIIIFVVLELVPRYREMTFDQKYLPVGGLLSGFFGGLSGHQGALRSAFLIKCGLNKESFIATGVVIACLVDLSRLLVYSSHFTKIGFNEHIPILVVSILAALAGVIIGKKMIKKVTLTAVQVLVSVMLLMIAVGLGAGLI